MIGAYSKSIAFAAVANAAVELFRAKRAAFKRSTCQKRLGRLLSDDVNNPSQCVAAPQRTLRPADDFDTCNISGVERREVEIIGTRRIIHFHAVDHHQHLIGLRTSNTDLGILTGTTLLVLLIIHINVVFTDVELGRVDNFAHDFDDSILDEAFDDVDNFELEQEVDGVDASESQSDENQTKANEESDIDELDDVPGLDDWLSSSDDEGNDSHAILNDLDSAEFDELLQSLESEEPVDTSELEPVSESAQSSEENTNSDEADEADDVFELDDAEELEEETTGADASDNDESSFAQDDDFELEDDDLESFFELGDEDELEDTFSLEEDDAPLNNAPLDEATLDDTEHKDSDDEHNDSIHSSAASDVAQEESLQLDNPDLDLAALLNDGSNDASSDDLTPPEDFLDVEALMDDGDDTIDPDSQELDLDVSLSEFTGVTDEDTVIDIDKDAGQNANLDLARAYIEMDDVDAAKELLEEVMVEGSDEQKEEAESILKSIR